MGIVTMFALFSIATIFLPSVLCGEALSCSQSCTKEQLPVCAHHPLKGYRTFPNQCSLDAEIRCNNEGWNFVHTGSCTEEECGPVQDCSVVCPAIYSPVCGYSPTSGFKTFSSQCVLGRQNTCYNGDYEYISDGDCKYEGPIQDCLVMCPAVYSPVCGYSETSGFKTFSSQCYLQLQNECIFGDYEYISEGKCEYEGPVQACSVVCPAIYSPVCGYSPTTGFKTFSNQCVLGRQNKCLFGDYKFAYTGNCKHEGQVEDCPKFCLAVYSPVCAYSLTDGFRTFSSQCFLDQQNECFFGDYVFAHLGQCTGFEIDRGCSGNCPRNYNPVCGLSVTKGFKTFPNLCVFGVTNRCKNGDYSLAHLGQCTRDEQGGACNQECPLYYVGVCGYSKLKDFKTFPNTCFLNRENSCTLSDYQLVHLGRCTPTEIGNKCNCVCKDIYGPVCGKSLTRGFKTFPNFCNLDKENSCNFADYRFIHKGECTPRELCDNC